MAHDETPGQQGDADGSDSSLVPRYPPAVPEPTGTAEGWQQRSPWASPAPADPNAAPPPPTQPYPSFPPYPPGGYGYPSAGPGPSPATGTYPIAGPPVANGGQGVGQNRRILLGALVIALAAALLGGGLGSVIGYQVAANGGRLSVLDSPLSNADSGPPGAVESVAQKVLPSVVQMRVISGPRSGAGSGMVISPDGLILTNNHVIENAAGGAGKINVLFQDGKIAQAQIVGRDPSSDVAVIKAENVSGLTPITLGNSDSLRVGQPVVAIGSPLGLGGTVTTGIVSALNRAVSVGSDDPGTPDSSEVLNAIQTDAAINPGNSGGPLVDAQGRLIGINTAIAGIGGAGDSAGSVGLGFSIPINQAKRIASELQRTGQATKPVLGVEIQHESRLAPLTDPPGAKVVSVTPPDGPAGQAGVKPGDVIVKIDNRAITTGDELIAAVRSHAPGETITLQLSDGRNASVALRGEPVPASR
ncbi:MAG: trypsin-like peptidase domain-containing protein [Pseudonocardia sp.]|nr:trypsin-like peptidase domain-containing protein [Pseudonocardia sp.]MBO0876867.1 trypsin-like peptidase domain-containing protein [Pseudonocardia sp.]